MAGHSKWANTKHRKAAQDSKKGKIFTKIIRELVTAAKFSTGSDPTTNPRLRAAVDKALFYNMNKDTLNRAIARGMSSNNETNIEKIFYEGYGPDGIAVMVECFSDNRNRSAAAVRHAFNKCGGHLGNEGSVAYLFNKTGVISFAQGEEDVIMRAALEAGALDIISYGTGSIEVHTVWEEIHTIREALELSGLEVDSATISMIPSTKIKINSDTLGKLLRLIDMLKNYNDTIGVYHNAEISCM